MKLNRIDKHNFRLFHDTGRILYRDDPNWIAPLDMEVENIFNPEKNSNFEHGEAIRWVLIDEQGRPEGRIAAFVNYKKAKKNDYPVGGMGFFECVNDQEKAAVLFDAAKNWLEERGMKAMDGSINFGENFSYWGVLVEGFMPQGYGMPYNKPYYQNLFETYGFKEYFSQFTYHIDLSKSIPERKLKFAEYLASRPGYTFRHFEKRKASKYIRDLVEVMNTTWEDYMEDYTPLAEKDVASILEEAKMLIEEDFIWFAYKGDQPVGMTVAFPDVNQLFSYFDGRLNFLKVLKMLWLKRRKVITRNRVLLAGVIPEYQNTGVIAALFLEFLKAVQQRPHYSEIELSWVGDYNYRMRKVYEQIGAVQKKRHVTYRFMMDSSIPFQRFSNERGNSVLRRDKIRQKR